MIDGSIYYSSTKSITKKMKTSDYVDLGLSVNWATFNIGATNPLEYGFYYAWGEIEPRDTSNYDVSYAWKDGYKKNKNVLDPEDDAAHVQWGGDWRMPTQEEMMELYDNCTVEFVTIDNINGYRFTSKIEGFTDKSIFLPTAGIFNYSVIYDYYCYYLSSTYDTINNRGTCCSYNEQYCYPGSIYGHDGMPVRPVCPSERYNGDDATSLTIEEDTVLIHLGDYGYTLSFNVKKGDIVVKRPVVWSTNDPTVVYVQEDGTIFGLKSGTTIVTATYKDLKDSCIVKVTGFQAVDLGLRVKWATCNVGADNPWDYGDYYAWGETEPKESYTIMNYKWYAGSVYYDVAMYATRKIKKYCTSPSESYLGQPDNKIKLEADDDIATIMGGNKWRMPTEDEIIELIYNCKWVWTTMNNVKGYKIYGTKSGFTDNYIFLPAAGGFCETTKDQIGSICQYWGSSKGNDYPAGGNAIAISGSQTETTYSDLIRWCGLPIRPVKTGY